MTLSYSFSGNFKRFSAAFKKQLQQVIETELTNAVDKLQKSSPVGATGELKAGWDIEILSTGSELLYKIVNNSDAAIFRLEGRRAGRFPPKNKIKLWVIFKFGNSKDVDSITYLISRKIAREGTNRSKRNFREFDPKTGKPAKNGSIDVAIKRINKKITQLRF